MWEEMRAEDVGRDEARGCGEEMRGRDEGGGCGEEMRVEDVGKR